MKVNNEIHNFYNQRHIKGISRKGYYDEKVEFYTNELERVAGKYNDPQILDIACNDGELAKRCFRKFGDVLGLDINKEAIKKCKKNGIKCKLGDVSSITKSHKSNFDIVIAGDIIEHIFDTDTFLENIMAVLKPGGTLLLTTANVASFGRRIMLLLGKNPFLEYSTKYPNIEINVGHIRYYTVYDMRLQMESLGFKNVEIYGDRINLSSRIVIPRSVAKRLPTLARYMHVTAVK